MRIFLNKVFLAAGILFSLPVMAFAADARDGIAGEAAAVESAAVEGNGKEAFLVPLQERDSVLIAAVPSEHTFIWNVTSQSEEQEIHISLLPDVKPGFDSETLAEGDDEGETPAVTDERRLYYLAVQAYADAEENDNTLIPFKDIEIVED